MKRPWSGKNNFKSRLFLQVVVFLQNIYLQIKGRNCSLFKDGNLIFFGAEVAVPLEEIWMDLALEACDFTK